MMIDEMCVNRRSLVLCFLKDLASSIQPVKMEHLEFGTAILVIVAVYLILVVKQVVYLARVHGFSQVPQMLLRY